MFDCSQGSGIVHCHQNLTDWLGEVGSENELGEKDIICVQIDPINIMGGNHFMKFFSYPDLYPDQTCPLKSVPVKSVCRQRKVEQSWNLARDILVGEASFTSSQ